MPRTGEPMWGTLGTCGFDERPLCLHCLHPLRPDAHFCKCCLAPVSSYAAFGFFGDGNHEAIWSTAWILGRATRTRRPTRLQLLVMVLVFGVSLISEGIWLSYDLAWGPFGYGQSLWGFTTFVVYLLLAISIYTSAAFLLRTCINYARHRDHAPDWDEADGDELA